MHTVMVAAESLMTAKGEVPILICHLFATAFLDERKSDTNGNIIEACLVLSDFQLDGVQRFPDDRLKAKQLIFADSCLAWDFPEEQVEPSVSFFPNINSQLQNHFRDSCD
jgi:hypothetical protein